MPDSAEDNGACRICMDPKDNCVSLFSHDLSKKVMEIADVQVEEDDGLPNSICTECEQDLEKCYEFRLKVQVADKKFRENIKFSKVDIEECNIKEERYVDDGNSDNMDDKDSVSMDDEHCNDVEPDVPPKVTEETEAADPDPLNHVVVVEEKERKVEMSDNPICQDDAMTEEPLEQKIEDVALDPLECMKEEAETEIMDIDSSQPDPFGPSSSVMSTALPTPFPILSSLSSGVVTLKNNFEMEINQQLKAPSKRTKARHLTVERKQKPLLPALNTQQVVTMEGNQHPDQGFMLIPQTGFSLNGGILIPCVKVTQKSIAIPKSYSHTLCNTPVFVNPSIQNATTAVTNTTHIGTQNNSMDTLSATTSSPVDNQNVTILSTVAVEGNICASNDTHENQTKHDKEETNSEAEFFCSVCNVDCGSLELLEEHKSEKTFICRVCTVIFNNHQELENHFFSHKKYTCDVCKKAFRVKADLLCHKNTVLTCNKPARHRCKICNNRFVHKIRLESHMEKKHPNGESRIIPCLVCKKHFKTLSQISHHLRTEHTAYENVVCDICQKIAAGPEKLKCHIKQVHLLSSECCPICKKTFSSKYSFKDHMEKHNGEELACDVCGAMIRGKISLKNHMRCHQSRIFPCKTCNMTFNGKSEIAKHNKKVHNKGLSQPVVCEVCGKVLKSSDILKLHMVTHSDEKPYVCEVCGDAFKLKVALTTHSRIHSDIRKYTCNHCGEGFRWKQTFDKHVLKCESSQIEGTSTESESE